MGPKGKSRAHYSHPQPSDYETDAPANVDIPPPPLRSNEELNLSVIRRHYPEVIAVHCVAPYAVLYAFSLDSEQWEKVGMEGSLFVCELLTAPNGAERYSVVILNRRSLDNFNMEITGLDGLEFTEDYIIMQGDQVYGLWIFSEPPPSSTANTRAEMVAKIQELAARVQASQVAVNQKSESEGAELDQIQESVPMGRQLSLRELFGQQRAQDSAWSTHNHNNVQQGSFQQNYQPTLNAQPQQDVLSQLFMKAKQDYNSLG